MSKAPSLVKWIFATIAFVSGSIVAQLLQPVTGKAGAPQDGLFVARSEAATPAAVDTLGRFPAWDANAEVNAPLSERGQLQSESIIEEGPQALPAVESQPVANQTAQNQNLPSVATPTERHTPQIASKPRVPTAVSGRTPSPLAVAESRVSHHKPVSRSIVRTPIASNRHRPVVTPQTANESDLSLTSLPSLSAEDTNFRRIRRDLSGQFQPLEGISQNTVAVAPPESRRQPLTSLARTTVLPTEMVPATKLEKSSRQTESTIRVARRGRNLKTKGQAVGSAQENRSSKHVASTATSTDEPKSDATQTSSPAPKTVSVRAAKPQSNLPTTADAVEAVELKAIGKNAVELSPELMALRRKVRRVLNMYREQEISVREKSAWSVMHSFIGYGVEKKVRIDHQGNRASAIGWICFNNPCRGVRLFYLKNGQIYGRLGPGNQGHEGQFLAMLAQSRVQADYPMKVEGRDFTVLDLVEREKLSCRPKTELTFKLIGLSHYLDMNETWRDDRGEKWDIPRLMKEEMRQPIIGAACGGTHRLFGLSYAVNRCVHKGNPIEGQYRRAEIYVKDYQKYTFKMQNPDGSFSTKFFSGRGAANDIDRRLLTTGHISEWLAFSLDREKITDPKMVKAVDYLAGLLLRGKESGWKVGPLGHALHALNIYNDRVFKDAAKPRTLASQTTKKQS